MNMGGLVYHFLDIFDDLEMADPPDFTEIDPRDEFNSIELGALLWISTLFYFSTSYINGPNSGNSCPKFLCYLEIVH